MAENIEQIGPAEKDLLIAEKKKKTKIRWLIIFLLVAVVFLFLRVFLQLIGSNPNSLFTMFVYFVSDIFMIPFFGMFHQIHPAIRPGHTITVDSAAFVAIFSYIILTTLAIAVIYIRTNMKKTNKEVDETIKKSKPVDKSIVSTTVD